MGILRDYFDFYAATSLTAIGGRRIAIDTPLRLEPTLARLRDGLRETRLPFPNPETLGGVFGKRFRFRIRESGPIPLGLMCYGTVESIPSGSRISASIGAGLPVWSGWGMGRLFPYLGLAFVLTLHGSSTQEILIHFLKLLVFVILGFVLIGAIISLFTSSARDDAERFLRSILSGPTNPTKAVPPTKLLPENVLSNLRIERLCEQGIAMVSVVLILYYVIRSRFGTGDAPAIGDGFKGILYILLFNVLLRLILKWKHSRCPLCGTENAITPAYACRGCGVYLAPVKLLDKGSSTAAIVVALVSLMAMQIASDVKTHQEFENSFPKNQFSGGR